MLDKEAYYSVEPIKKKLVNKNLQNSLRIIHENW